MFFLVEKVMKLFLICGYLMLSGFGLWLFGYY